MGARLAAMLEFSNLGEGRPEAARALFDATSSEGFDLRRGMSRVFSLAIWGEVAAALDDRRAAAQVLELLDPVAGHLADSAGLVWSSVDQVRAQLASALGDT